MSEQEFIPFRDIVLANDRIHEYIQTLDSAELQVLGLNFADSMTSILNLLCFPFLLVTVNQVWQLQPQNEAELEATQGNAIAQTNRFMETMMGPAGHDGAKRSLHDIASAALIFSWTGFEVLAQAVWIELLNQRPKRLLPLALSGVPDPEPDGLNGKMLKVEYLARYDFDIRRQLGTLLADKYKFSAISDIQDAYKAAFRQQRATWATLNAVLEGVDLDQLQKTRNLIAHRHGIIDQQYIDATGSAQSVGERVRLDSRILTQLIAAGIDAGRSLLEFGTEILRTVTA